MVRALLLALTCAAVASGGNYVEYSGIKMPQYGGADYDVREPPLAHLSEDYHGHSADAPASLDYKYEEEQRSKTVKPSKEPDDSNLWRKSERKQRDSVQIGEVDNRERKYVHDYDDEMPNSRTNQVYSKHRSRLKNEIETDEESPLPRRHNQYSRDRKRTDSDIDRKDYFVVDKDYMPNDKNNDFDEDMKEETTKRSNRRKHRDRQFKRPSDNSHDYYDREKNEADTESRNVYPHDTFRRDTNPLNIPGALHFQPQLDQSRDSRIKVAPIKTRMREYHDYEDYYDMKRVNNIKSRLPSLLQRTTGPSLLQRTTVKGAPRLTTTLLQILRTHLYNYSIRVENPTRTTLTPTTTKLVQKITLHELSIAEKSRLSILKNSKQGQATTKKPAVLLQMTSVMPTMVMVEASSSSSTEMWLRSNVVSSDTPEDIKNARRLMRNKLVKDAKNIHDLTSNWNDMVCDYIDTSLLSGAVHTSTPNIWLFLLCLQLPISDL